MKTIEKEDTRNFAEKWLDQIYESLMRIADYERLAKNGCIQLEEFIRSHGNINMDIVQEKNYQLFMTECEILLNDIKTFAPPEKLLKLILKFNTIKKIEDDAGGFLQKKLNMVNNTHTYILKDTFHSIHILLSDLRGNIINTLFEYINPKLKRKEEERI